MNFNLPAVLRDDLFLPFETQFNEFANKFLSSPVEFQKASYPKVDVYEVNDKFVVEYSVAGVDPEKVAVEIKETFNDGVQKRTLKVSGKMDTEFEHKTSAVYFVKEFTRKAFSRTMTIPDYVKGDPVATYKNGILTLTFDLPEKKSLDQTNVKSIPVSFKKE